MADQKRAFVAGHPISHSRSPLIHGFWLNAHDLDGSYEAIDVAPENFAGFLSGFWLSDWIGGNITIPHKQAAFAAIERKDAAAKAIGAINTIWREGSQVCCSNTDAYGFAANLDDHAPHWRDGSRALVIGAGGASRAVLHALTNAGYGRIDLVNRTMPRAEELAHQFGSSIHPHGFENISELAPHGDLIVNATSLGMTGQSPLDLPFEVMQDEAIATDLVYAPLETPFLKAAKNRGLVAVDGLGMLLHQAAPGFERWFGIRPEVTQDLRAHVVADLEGGHRTS